MADGRAGGATRSMQCDATMRSTDSFRFASCNFNFNYNYAMIPFFLSQLVLFILFDVHRPS
jgi:hypothetical protein